MSTAESGSPALVARVLVSRGSVREGIALLRGAVARDHEEDECAALLAEVLAGRAPSEPPDAPRLSLELVDAWIRRGMLVEALALLGGTPMGSDETGREWANLLGELLAPVPVDAEEALVAMHQHLVTGGAPVALVLLEERSRREPALPAWATRRLDVLRWMLLDNAGVAESHPELAGDAPASALASAVRDAVNARDLRATRAAALRFAQADPADPDPPAVVRAVERILLEIERHADEGGTQARTLPMFGHPAAAMQLRMGNLAQAVSVYRKLLAKDPNDDEAREVIDAVEAVLRAARGEAVADEWTSDTEVGTAEELVIPATLITATPQAPEREKSGPVTLGEIPEGLDDEGSTLEMLSWPKRAEALLAEGKLEEAELCFRSLAGMHPDDPSWARRADEVRALRSGADDADVVLVRAIRRIE